MARIATLCLLLLGAQASWDGNHDVSQSQCSAPKSVNFKLSLVSRRNQTGHWTSKAQVEYKSKPDSQQTTQLEVDIDQTVTKCHDEETVVIVATATAPPVAPSVHRPGPDYEFIPNFGYYKLNPNIKTWLEAYDVCKQEHAHLLIVNSEEEAKAVQRLWIRHPKNLGDWRDSYCFVGIHDQFKEGAFVTIFNEPLNETGYTKWSTEPSGTTSENCGMINVAGEYGDSPCGVRMPFICEQEL